MRCNDCNKFVGQEPGEPEAELEAERIDATTNAVQVTGSIRLAVVCAECGTDLKEATFDVDETIEIEGHRPTDDETHDLEVEIDQCEATETYKGREGAPARYQKHYYGVDCQFSISCSCGQLRDVNGSYNDEVQASGMDEC
jgi:hypothetical protein